MVGVIIQARMGSSRLPGKTMKEICGKPILYYSVKRAMKSKYSDLVIVATSAKSKDDIIYNWCIENGIHCYRGSENDVLDRYYQCAKKYDLKIIVRATADNPFIDPTIIDLLILNKELYNCNYVTMRHNASRWPYGLDVEIIDVETLNQVWSDSKLNDHREHVTKYIKDNEFRFKIKEVSYD